MTTGQRDEEQRAKIEMRKEKQTQDRNIPFITLFIILSQCSICYRYTEKPFGRLKSCLYISLSLLVCYYDEALCCICVFFLFIVINNDVLV